MRGNLSRTEASERARLIQTQTYQTEFDFTGPSSVFTAVTVITFSCSQPGATTFAELTAPAVTRVTLNGEALDPSVFDGDRISLAGLAAQNELRVTAQCAYSRAGSGLHRFTDPADGGVYLYTDLEPYDARRVFACFDQPDLKATFEVTALVPPGWTVISNSAPDVRGEPAGPGRCRWHFPPTAPLSTYITAIAAGPYHEVTARHDGIPLGLYCRQSLAGSLDAEEIFEITGQGFDYFHAAFGVRYPFGKYDQLFVPEYKSGAMENAACVTFTEDYLFRSRVTQTRREARAQTILHEMAHMWFGDLVTMRWWDDLWLNESFASWAEMVSSTEATRWADGWTSFAHTYKAWAYRQDQLPSTHPVAADIPDIDAVEVNFDGITYAKGAAVLKQLVAYVGRDNFLAGVRAYFGQHAFGNATLADLLAALEAASGRDLAGWSSSWLESAGVTTLRPEFTLDSGGRFTTFTVRQDAPAEHPQLRPHRIAIGLYDQTSADGETMIVRRERVELDIAGSATAVPDLVGQRQPDLIIVNDDDLTYAKIRLDDRSLRTLMTAIGSLHDQLAAAVCWSAAWDMTRDGDLAARDFVTLVIAGASAIRQVTVLEPVLSQALVAIRRYCEPAWRQDGLARLDEAVRQWLTVAEPGSDHQLAYARALADAATSAASLALLAGLLDGSVTVAGLAVDTDLRWQLLRRLVSQGQAGSAAIDAELTRDPTDEGERQAARCRAAVPTPAAKQAAWAAVTGGELPNATFKATLRGFRAPDQDELISGFAAGYYEALAALWRDGATDMAQYFTAVAYPVAVSPAAIAVTDDYIASAEPSAALTRLLAEGRDDTARALCCQQRDAAAGAAGPG